MKLYEEKMDLMYDKLYDFIEELELNVGNFEYQLIRDGCINGYECIILIIDNDDVHKSMLFVNNEEGMLNVILYSDADNYIDFDSNDNNITYVGSETFDIEHIVKYNVSEYFIKFNIIKMCKAQLKNKKEK